MKTRFEAAIVQLTPGGRSYPVNCPASFKVGDRVLVRMKAQEVGLARGEITSLIHTSSPCRNSVACLESDQDYYGAGPGSITDLASLKSLLEFLEWQSVPTKYYGLNPLDEISRYHTAFIEYPEQKWGVPLAKRYGLEDPRKVIYIGEVHRSPGGGDHRFLMGGFGSVRLEAGHLVLFASPGSTVLGSYAQAAEWAEGVLEWPVDPPMADTTIDEIKNALDGGHGGPTYLSDGVWI